MSKTVLANVDGFTPLMDSVVDECGIMQAAVFGKMWRYCQMEDGVCWASQERLAQELGISRPTVNAHIKSLVDAGYLIDLTPDLAGVPHRYADSGKAGLSINFTATSKKSLQPPVKIFDTKKEVKKESDIYTTPSAEIQTDKVIEFMFSIGMFPNSMTGDLLKTWREKHTDDWIIKALETAKGKSQSYADKVLIGWEANGYPKTREQLIEERKAAKPAYKPQAEKRIGPAIRSLD